MARVAAWGRPRHARLRVLFAALAGGAPLLGERVAARGGPAAALHDPLIFFDTSSFGARAIDAAIRAVGVDALVHGSDAPVVAASQDPAHGLGPGVAAALTLTNPARLLCGTAAIASAPPRGTGDSRMIKRPSDRDLTPAELEHVARDVAARPELWSGLVAHDPAARTYEELLRDDYLTIWLICWMHDHDTGFHDHDVSSGAVAVASGAVREDRLVLGAQPASRVDPTPARR